MAEQHRMPDGEGQEIEGLLEEGPELNEDEVLGFDDGPSEEVEPANVEHDEVRDGA